MEGGNRFDNDTLEFMSRLLPYFSYETCHVEPVELIFVRREITNVT